MRKRLLTLLALTPLLGAAQAVAGDGSFSLQVMGGWSSASERTDGGDIYTSGAIWGIGLDYSATEWLNVVVEVGYKRMPFDAQNQVSWRHKWNTQTIPDGNAATNLSAGLHMKVGALGRTRVVAPYLLAGAHVSRTSHDLTSRNRDDAVPPMVDPRGYFISEHQFADSQKALWLVWGAGVEIRVSRGLALLAEARRRDPLAAEQLEVGMLQLESAGHYNVGVGILLRM